AAIIWSRASEFTQSPGNKRDLGVELDLQVYYQAKDGSLNDDLEKIGGFYAALQYGVFFPLGGLDYLPGVTSNTSTVPDWSTSAAQSVKLFLGVMY
ncbi:MAG: TIGR04551 family protein, partial [Polyangiaceae bacterium]